MLISACKQTPAGATTGLNHGAGGRGNEIPQVAGRRSGQAVIAERADTVPIISIGIGRVCSTGEPGRTIDAGSKGARVASLVAETLPVDLQLAALAIIVALGIGHPSGAFISGPVERRTRVWTMAPTSCPVGGHSGNALYFLDGPSMILSFR